MDVFMLYVCLYVCVYVYICSMQCLYYVGLCSKYNGWTRLILPNKLFLIIYLSLSYVPPPLVPPLPLLTTPPSSFFPS